MPLSPLPSSQELPGSPLEQTSWATETYYWSPAAEIASGATLSLPTVHVYQYDPLNPGATTDATATVCPGGASLPGGAYAGDVAVTVAALTAGMEYRVQLGCTSSDGNKPAKFFRLQCRV